MSETYRVHAAAQRRAANETILPNRKAMHECSALAWDAMAAYEIVALSHEQLTLGALPMVRTDQSRWRLPSRSDVHRLGSELLVLGRFLTRKVNIARTDTDGLSYTDV